MSSLQCSALMHSFDGYKFLWNEYFKSATHNLASAGIMRGYFATDIDNGYRAPDPWYTLFTGLGTWSGRLKIALQQIDTKYVLYMQEDQWPFKAPPDINSMVSLMEHGDLLRLQISPVNHYYKLYGGAVPLIFHPGSKYLVSHQPSIWDREFFMECLWPDEDPWQNEYRGTIRLSKLDKIKNRIAIYPCNWFDHVCIKGEFKAPIQRSG